MDVVNHAAKGPSPKYNLLLLSIVAFMAAGALVVLLAPMGAAQTNGSVSTISTNVAIVNIVSGAQNQNNGIFYSPANITVVIGVNNTVMWTNHDSTEHTVVALDGSYSATLQPGQTFTHTFIAPGVYDYHCTIHPWMKGSVTVLASPSSSTTSTPSTGGVPEFPFTALAAAVFTAVVLVSYLTVRRTRRG